MKVLCVYLLGLGILMLMASVTEAEDRKEEGGPMIVHAVYFTLKESTPAGREKLTAACKKYLTGHPGTVFFAAGPLAPGFERPVNVRDFDVAFLVVFKDKAAHDAYQDAPRHLQFIEENKESWKQVRVFDSEATK